MDILGSIFNAVWGTLGKLGRWLANSPFATIWQFMQKIFARVHQVIQWINKYVLQPWEKMRQQLIALYNHYFGPIIKFIDTIRSTARILAIFDRKLAAKIDQALWQLESDLYAPLYAALKRLNAVTATIRAVITSLGLLDRSLLVQSVERDWKSIWRVLMNNGTLPKPLSVDPTAQPLHKIQTDFDEFVTSGTGTFADSNQALDQVYQDALTQLQ